MHTIAIISGSARIGRQTPKAVAYLTQVLEISPSVVKVHVLDVATYNFPIYGMTEEEPEGVAAFRDIIKCADAIVFASPEYNGTMTGVFKNTIDYFYSEFSKKPIGVMTVTSGKLGGINASHHLQSLILSLGAYPVPCKLLVGNVDAVIDESGHSNDPELIKKTNQFRDELLWITAAIVDKKRKEQLAGTYVG